MSFVIITIALISVYILGWLPSFPFQLLAGTHAGMCIGDFYYLLLLVKAPKDAKIEDTPSEMKIYYS